MMAEVYEKAEELFTRGKLDEALKFINDSGIHPSQSPNLWALKARCLTHLKRDDDAFQAALEVFQVGTDNVGILSTLGEGHFKNGDYDSACHMFSLAVNAVPDRKDKQHFKKRYTKALDTKRKHGNQMRKKLGAEASSTADSSISEACTTLNLPQLKEDSIDASSEGNQMRKKMAAEASSTAEALIPESCTTLNPPRLKEGSIDASYKASSEDKQLMLKKFVAEASVTVASTTKTSTVKAVEASMPEVVEVDVSINPLPKASNEGASSKPLLTWSSEHTFSIHRHLHGHVYEGDVSCSLGKVPKAFIEVEEYLPYDQMDALQKLASEADNILRVDYFVEMHQKQFFFMIVDHVVPIDYFFKCQLERFRSMVNAEINLTDAKKKLWWDFIVKDFTQIFRDVAHGLMSLYFLGKFCGDLKNNIYVTKENRGKILPSLHVSRKETNKEMDEDIRDFRMKIQYILALPFRVYRFASVDDLSFELESLILCFDRYRVTPTTPAFWIANHPYFWTWAERIAYISKIKDLLKRNVIEYERFERCVLSHESFKKSDIHGLSWDSCIEEGVFKELYKKPRKSGGKVMQYGNGIHLIRYMTACYAHVNDSEYGVVRKEKIYTENEVEGYLRSIFPRIYVDLHETFYAYSAISKSIGEELLKNMSSCCSKKEYYRTL